MRDGISQRCASLSFIGGGVSLRLSLSILLLLINAAQSDHSAVLRLTSRGKNRKQQQLNYFYISVLLLSLSLCAHFRTLFARVAKLVSARCNAVFSVANARRLTQWSHRGTNPRANPSYFKLIDPSQPVLSSSLCMHRGRALLLSQKEGGGEGIYSLIFASVRPGG